MEVVVKDKDNLISDKLLPDYFRMKKIFSKIPNNEFLKELFEDNDKCLEFIANIKWEYGFVCKKCGNTNYCEGKSPFSKRCTKCKHDESAIAHTVFHNCKFPINKAFYIAYHICNQKKQISSYEFARRLSIRQMTCWKFKTKIKNALDKIKELYPDEQKEIEKILNAAREDIKKKLRH